jgi:MtrB/PioB family decaheme-associated outer membrane protein
MRISRLAIFVGALILPALASAQAADGQAAPASTPAAKPAEAATGTIREGSVDFGALVSSVKGDEARYNRFRDLSNGPWIDGLRMSAVKSGWYMGVAADHVGREDARYGTSFVLPGTFKGSFQFDQIRELVSNSTRALFTETTPGVLRVDDHVQTQLEAAGANGTLGTVLPKVLENFALPFELGTRRHIASGGVEYIINPSTTVRTDLSHTSRTGNILYSGTFGFSQASDIPQPINQNTSNVDMTIEHQHKDMLLRAGYTGSYFRNDVSLITWDNPYRLNDATTLSSQGRTQVAPSNNWSAINASFSTKLPAHSRFTAYTAFGFLDDHGQTMIQQTINTAITIKPVTQPTVGGKGETRNVNLTFVSHPTHMISFNAQYRFYDYVNQTPIYSNGVACPCDPGVTAGQRVQYDASLQGLTFNAPEWGWYTPRYGGTKQTASADVHIAVPEIGSIGAGYVHNGATYQDRFYTGSGENVFRVSFDTLSMHFVSLHTKYEHGIRRGTPNNVIVDAVVAAGEQPSILHYDIADRDRDLFTLAASIFPVDNLSVTFSAGDGRDGYPSTNFGLTSAKHKTYGVGFDYVPTDHVSFNLSFNQDTYDSLQYSRTANPAPDPTFTDPSKDWSDTGADKTYNVIGAVRLANLCHDKLDVNVGYDYTRGRGSYIYGTSSAPLSPDVPTTLPPPVQLPPLSNDFVRTTVDFTYKFTPKFSLGFSYWYEDFKVDDLALGSAALPDLGLGTSDILMGYQYLPYTAHSYFMKATVRW